MLFNFSVDDASLNKKKQEGLSITEIIEMSKSINSDWVRQEAEKKIPESHKGKDKDKPQEETIK